MKKKYLILTGIVISSLMLAACGKKESAIDNTETVVTETPTPEPTEGALVEMEKDEDADIKNIIGTKTDSASKLTMTNELGDVVAEMYIRPNTSMYTDNDEWGEELIRSSFTLEDKDQALYYFDPEESDEAGEDIEVYDIRLGFEEDEDGSEKDEYFFRELPLANMDTLTFCIDTSEGMRIPYVKFTLEGSTKEYSTLEAVKKRIGMSDSDYDEDDSDDDPTPTPYEYNAEPTVTPSSDNGGSDNNPTPEPSYDDDDYPADPGAAQAETFIGQSLDSLIGSMGSPEGSSYEDEPETGTTGYHYYSTFTVSTTVDSDGNEVVTGVW